MAKSVPREPQRKITNRSFFCNKSAPLSAFEFVSMHACLRAINAIQTALNKYEKSIEKYTFITKTQEPKKYYGETIWGIVFQFNRSRVGQGRKMSVAG